MPDMISPSISVYACSANRLCLPYRGKTNIANMVAREMFATIIGAERGNAAWSVVSSSRIQGRSTRCGATVARPRLDLALGTLSNPTMCRILPKTGIDCRLRRLCQFVREFQFLNVWQSKFQSWPLCSVDALSPSLQTCSLFYEEGVE